MNATASLPAPLHVRRGHVIGLSVAVAAVAVVALATTWALRVNSDTSSAPLKAHPTLQQVVSTITPDQDYVAGIVAMTRAELVAALGGPPQRTPDAAADRVDDHSSRADQSEPCGWPALCGGNHGDESGTARRHVRHAVVRTSFNASQEPGRSSAGLHRVDVARLSAWSGCCSARWPKRSGARCWLPRDADISFGARSCSTRAIPATRST